MGQITIKTKDGKTATASGRYFVDGSGNFLGEYFLDEKGETLTGAMPLPLGAIEADSQPDSYRHIWDARAKIWSDPGPSKKDQAREAEKQEAETRKAEAVQKLESMGITAEDLKAALS